MQLLETVDQIGRSSVSFREMTDAVARLLRARLPHYGWIGFYMIEDGGLVLGSWDGPAPTEHVRIPIGQGICGAAAATGETVVVDDVSADPRYLQCFLSTRSEIVVPISWGGEVIGEIDIDSDRPGAFNGTDRAFLEAVAVKAAARWARERIPLAAETRVTGGPRDPELGIRSVAPPIHASATYAHESAAALEEYLAHQDRGYLYTRWGNPTIRAAEDAVAALEGAEDAALFASGMAAIATTLLAILRQGDEVVAPYNLYGGTYHLLEDVLPAYGIAVRFVEFDSLPRIADFLTDRTRVVYFEPVANPTLRVVDTLRVAESCRARGGVSVVVDNTLATPINLRALEHGADLVIHSATKYLGGHSDLIAGVVSGRREAVERIRHHGRYLGGCFNPREAWLLARGLKTLPLRVARQNASALRLARMLEGRPEVRRVWHPLLESHPDQALAARVLGGGGGLVTIELAGGLEMARHLVDRLTLWHHAPSLGGVESLVSIPVLASHWNVPAHGLQKAGITPGTVRLSVGIEDPADLEADLARALLGAERAARGAATAGASRDGR